MHHPHVILSGASGLIGSALTEALRADKIQVTRLVRRPARSADELTWDPDAGALHPDALAGASVVINLNGASIARMPWTRGYRETLRTSRLHPTRTLARAIHQLGPDAPHFISASAVGYYGDRPGEPLTESACAGETFLAGLCAEWENAASEAGERVSFLRTAPLLHSQAVLKPLITLTSFGLGGPLGSGRQLWPWISLADEVRAILHIMSHEITGPVNLSGPTPASAREIGEAIAKHLHRPYLVPAPAWALRLGLGRDAADALLLADAQVVPDALAATGFTFTHPTAQSAIRDALSD